MTSSIEKVRGSPSLIELSMTSPSGVHAVKVTITLSWGPGCAAPWPLDRTRQARPLAVFVAAAGGSATSGGAEGAAGTTFCSGSIGWAVDVRAVDKIASSVVAARMCRRGASIPPAYHENDSPTRARWSLPVYPFEQEHAPRAGHDPSRQVPDRPCDR